MKYLFSFLFCLILQSVFAQESRRAETPVSAADSMQLAARRFEGRLGRLREAWDKNDVSAMTSCYARLRGDMRSAIGYIETQAPESRQLAAMKSLSGKFEGYAFDPMKAAELKPYLAHFEAFLALLKEEAEGRN